MSLLAEFKIEIEKGITNGEFDSLVSGYRDIYVLSEGTWSEICSGELEMWKSIRGPFLGMLLVKTKTSVLETRHMPIYLVICSQTYSNSFEGFQINGRVLSKSFVAIDLNNPPTSFKTFSIILVIIVFIINQILFSMMWNSIELTLISLTSTIQ